YDANERPKPDAQVTLAGFVGGAPQSFRATTGPNGRYEVSGLPPGDYTVIGGEGTPDFRRMTEVSSQERVRVSRGERVEHDVYDRVPGTVTIEGTVLQDGEPYTGRITIAGGGFQGNAL